MKHLIFAFALQAEWPSHWPTGPIVPEEARFLTLTRLENVSFQKLSPLLEELPPPPFSLGLQGVCDRSLFLPYKDPQVVAWHVRLFQQADRMISYQQELVEWLFLEGFEIERRDYIPHVTLAYPPFLRSEWALFVKQLPVKVMKLGIYQSIENEKYSLLWSYPYVQIGAFS